MGESTEWGFTERLIYTTHYMYIYIYTTYIYIFIHTHVYTLSNI